MVTAEQWPFSSVGTGESSAVNEEVIFSHPSLQQVYIDRIIERKEKGRIKKEAVKARIKEVTGAYSAIIWPEFEND